MQLKNISYVHSFCLITIFLLVIGSLSYAQEIIQGSYIRNNLVGYLPGDKKVAVVGSQKDIEGEPFHLMDADNPDNIIYSGKISKNRGIKYPF